MTRPNWFVALAVPPGDWWERIPPPPDGVRLFDPRDLHVTVAFLGAVDRAAAEAAFALADEWPDGSFDLALGEVEAMGDARRPAAFAARVEAPGSDLAATMGVLRRRMWQRAGARGDKRAPKPHVTIARPPRRAEPHERAMAKRWLLSIDLGSARVRIRELVLYTWSDDRRDRQFREHLTRTLEMAV